MTDREKTEYLSFAKQLAIEAGAIMHKYHRSARRTTTWKDDNSPVTLADRDINSLVIQKIKDTFPDHGVIGEEESYEADRSYVWVVDPIDGTAPFDLGMQCST